MRSSAWAATPRTAETPPSVTLATRLRPHLPWAAAGLVTAIVCALVLARPYDGALNRSAASGTYWTDHLVRAETALVRAEGRGGALDWIVAADQGYPPLIHWVAVPLGDALGRDAGTVERFGLIWLLLLVGATGVIGAAVTEDRAAGALAAATLATFPAVHGTALGYFYDLPMTALLFGAAAALLAGGTTRPVASGIAAGLFFATACTAKWTAVALAPPLVLGVLLTRRDGRRPWAATGIAATVGLAGAALFFRLSSKSLLAMAGTGYGAQQSGGGDVAGTVRRILFESGGPLGEAIRFLPIRLVLGALGPALAVVVLASALVWAARSRAGLPLAACVLAGDVLVIHRFFPALNDRWLISIVPVVAVIAAAGVRALPRGRGAAAIALLALGVGGTWEFHHGDSHARAAAAAGGDRADWNELRSWSAASSTEPQLGWARADYRTNVFLANRESLWDAVARCGGRDVLIHESVSTAGDAPWWRYRDTLHRLATSAPLRYIGTLDGTEMTAPERAGDAPAVARVAAGRPGPPGWPARAVVPAHRGAPAVALWTPAGASTCASYGPPG